MGQIRIVTDSTGDLDLATLAEANIGLVPVMINFQRGSYREQVDMTTAEFYQYMKESEKLPTTAQPSPGEMHQMFASLVSQGYEVLAYFISGELSGSCQTAELIARNFPEGSVTAVDSRSVSIGLGCMAYLAAKAAAKGCTKAEILQLTGYISQNIKIYFVVDSLDNLRKGGRIGKATAFLGTMLNIRPLLEIKDGMVCPVERIRGKGRAVEHMTDLVKTAMDQHPGLPCKLFMGHGNALDEMNKYKPEILEKLGVKAEAVTLVEVGAAVGTHAGAGLLALAYLPWPPALDALVGQA